MDKSHGTSFLSTKINSADSLCHVALPIFNRNALSLFSLIVAVPALPLGVHFLWCWASPSQGTVSPVFFPASNRVGNLKSQSQVVAGSQRAADHRLTSTGTNLIAGGDGLCSRCTRCSAFSPFLLCETHLTVIYISNGILWTYNALAERKQYHNSVDNLINT